MILLFIILMLLQSLMNIYNFLKILTIISPKEKSYDNELLKIYDYYKFKKL